MTGVKISALPAANAANDSDQLEVNQGGISRRVTVGQIATSRSGLAPIYDFYSSGPFNSGDATADTAALQAFYDSSAPACLIPPTGQPFLINSRVMVRSDKTLWGLSKSKSLIRRANNAAGFSLFGLNDVTTGEPVANNLAFRGLGFDGNRTGQSSPSAAGAVFHIDCSGVGFDFCDNAIFNFSQGGHGLHVKGINGVRITNNDFYDGGTGLYHASYFLRCDNFTYMGNSVWDVPAQGMKFSSNSGIGTKAVIVGNRFRNVERGMNVSDASDVTISGNVIEGAADTGIRFGVESDARVYRANITGNHVRNAFVGIGVATGSDIVIASNTLDGCNSRGINVSNPVKVSITGNYIYNVLADPAGLMQISVSGSTVVSLLAYIAQNMLRLDANPGVPIRIGISSTFTDPACTVIGHNVIGGPNYSATVSSPNAPCNLTVSSYGAVSSGDAISLYSEKMGFFKAAAAIRPTVSGSRAGNAALASLLTGLASMGLLVDSTTA